MVLSNTKVYLKDGVNEEEFIIPKITLSNIGSEEKETLLLTCSKNPLQKFVFLVANISTRPNSQSVIKNETSN